VLDSCRKSLTQDTELHINKAQSAEQPLEFIGAASTCMMAEISDLRVLRLKERPSFARISAEVLIPLQVTYQDTKGKRFRGDSTITLPVDVVMYVPDASVFPFEVTASAGVNCTAGKQIRADTFSVTACITLIVKVIAETDLLIPTYGYCPSPKAVDFEQQACSNFFDLPLYPSGKQINREEK